MTNDPNPTPWMKAAARTYLLSRGLLLTTSPRTANEARVEHLAAIIAKHYAEAQVERAIAGPIFIPHRTKIVLDIARGAYDPRTEEKP